LVEFLFFLVSRRRRRRGLAALRLAFAALPGGLQQQRGEAPDEGATAVEQAVHGLDEVR
jgi:hypothetical protein